MNDEWHMDMKHFFILNLFHNHPHVSSYLITTKCFTCLPTYILTTYNPYLFNHDTYLGPIYIVNYLSSFEMEVEWFIGKTTKVELEGDQRCNNLIDQKFASLPYSRF
jgi:hypothetical protein